MYTNTDKYTIYVILKMLGSVGSPIYALLLSVSASDLAE